MAKIKLYTLSPIHIGGGSEELSNGLDYLKLGNYVYVLNRDKLYEFLYERKLFDKFLSGMDRIEWLEEFLKRESLLKSEILEPLSFYKTYAGALIPNRVRPFVRDIFGRAFIPGSSVKGFLRSSLIYLLASSLGSEELGRSVLDSLHNLESGRIRERREQAKRVGEFLNEEVSRFFLPNARDKLHRDIFRVVSLKDSLPLKEDDVRVYEGRLIKENGQMGGFGIPIEALKPDVEIELELSMNEFLFSEFRSKNEGKLPFSSLKELFSMAEGFGGKVLDLEISFFNKSEDSKNLAALVSGFKGKAVGKMGWGTGIEGITVLSLLPKSVREEVRRRFYQRSRQDVFPRTRRVIVERSKPVIPVGWFELRYED